MYQIGQKEIDNAAKVIISKKIFRYGIGNECCKFEERYAKLLNVKHVHITSSGTTALTAALIGRGIGPGDEVLVPSCTYMATPVSVLSAGAIPVVVDIDDSITIDPTAMEQAIGKRTRAAIPVHMWGLSCDMDKIMHIARKHKLLVVEDACQAVGGGYKGKMLGAIGHAGAFSFNYFKNMTCGEGGAAVTNSKHVMKRIQCMIDCCNIYWNKRGEHPFVSNGSRASEIEGALLNAQITRIMPMIRTMRKQKMRILRETGDTGLTPIRANSLEFECGTHVMYILPNAGVADKFAESVKGVVAGKTGRHVYTEWDPILEKRGAHHPALNPFSLKENKDCRQKYTKTMCKKSLDILDRTVMVQTNPDFSKEDIDKLIKRIKQAAKKK